VRGVWEGVTRRPPARPEGCAGRSLGRLLRLRLGLG
jgi:hypothetical protein